MSDCKVNLKKFQKQSQPFKQAPVYFSIVLICFIFIVSRKQHALINFTRLRVGANIIVAETKYHDDLVKLYLCFIFILFAGINTIRRLWIKMYNEHGHIYKYNVPVSRHICCIKK